MELRALGEQVYLSVYGCVQGRIYALTGHLLL